MKSLRNIVLSAALSLGTLGLAASVHADEAHTYHKPQHGKSDSKAVANAIDNLAYQEQIRNIQQGPANSGPIVPVPTPTNAARIQEANIHYKKAVEAYGEYAKWHSSDFLDNARSEIDWAFTSYPGTKEPVEWKKELNKIYRDALRFDVEHNNRYFTDKASKMLDSWVSSGVVSRKYASTFIENLLHPEQAKRN